MLENNLLVKIYFKFIIFGVRYNFFFLQKARYNLVFYVFYITDMEKNLLRDSYNYHKYLPFSSPNI